ncbi:hypothetical protein DYB30_001487 [Aphanomyces astaci]|uniref:Chromatin-remodeling ATPase INO80 n=2 Tax=Aphanomyces astaci TaxID=112090 RepID=A0A397DFV8_APHAT|nr:hypothetical protein DYB30_001487 [Aphanomyces astaci]
MDMKRRLLRVDHLPMMALQLTESNSLEIRTPHVEFHPHAVDVVETGSAFKLQEVAASPHLVKEDAARKKHIGKVELEACLVGTEFQGRFPDQGALLGDVYDDVPDESDEGVYDALEKAYNAAFSNSTMDRVERDRKFHQQVGQVTLAHRAPHHHLPKRQSTSESFGAWKERLLEGRKDAIFAVLKSKALDDLNDYRLNAMRNRKLELDASDVWRDDIVGTSAVETAATHLDERLGRRKAALRDLAARCRDLQLKRQTRPQSNDSLGDNATMTKGDEISSSPLPATTSNGHNPIMVRLSLMVALLVGGVASGPPSLVVTPHVLEWEAAFASSSSVRVVSYWGRPDDRKLMRTMWRPPRVHVVLTHPQTLEQDAAGDLESVLWQVVTCDHTPPRRPVNDKEDGYPSPPWSGRALGLRCRQRWLMLSTEAKVDLRLLLHFVAPALFDSKQKTMAWGTAALDDVAVQSLRSIVQRVCVGPSEALDEATRHTLDVTADERAVLMALDSTPSIEYVLATPSKEGPSEMDYLEKYKRRNSHAKIVVDTKRLMLRTPTTPMMFETPSSSIELSLPKPPVVDPKLIACKHCAKTFMTSSGLLKHTKSDHAPPGTWTCRKCGVDCGTMALRNAHERQEHDESITPANKPTEQLLVAATTWTTPAPHTPGSAGSSASTKPSRRSTGGGGGGKKRVTRCGKCAGCVSGDCMECGHCQDMKKYGGPGLRKQSCKNRKCTNPQVLGSVGGDDDSSKVRVEFDESESSGESSSESADPRRDSIDHSIDDGDADDDDDDAPIKSPHAAKSKASRGAASRTRVMRCGVCVGCVAGDCLKCRHCQDMKKYGGPGLRKQSCKSRKCVTPKVVLLNQGQEDGDDDDDDDLLYDEPHHQHTPRSSTSTTTSSATPTVPHPPTTTTPLWEKETLVDAASALAPSVRLQAQLNRFLKITCLRCNAKFLNQSLKSVHDAVVHERHATSLWQRTFVRDRLATLQFQHTLVATDPRRKKSLEFEPVGYAKLVGPGLTYYMLRPQATLGRVGSEWKDRYRTMGVDLRRGFSGGDVDCHLGDDLMISAQHAKIRWDVRRQRFVIECLSVLAPLSVNGLEVTFDMAPLPLASQSLVQVGAFYFFFLLPVASSNNHPPSIAADIAQTSRHRQGLPRQEVYAWLAHKRAALRLSRLQQDQESHIKRKGDSVDDTELKRLKVNPHEGAAGTTDMGSRELDRRTAA